MLGHGIVEPEHFSMAGASSEPAIGYQQLPKHSFCMASRSLLQPIPPSLQPVKEAGLHHWATRGVREGVKTETATERSQRGMGLEECEVVR